MLPNPQFYSLLFHPRATTVLNMGFIFPVKIVIPQLRIFVSICYTELVTDQENKSYVTFYFTQRGI